MTKREVLLDLPLERLKLLTAELGLPAYRAGQIFNWLHKRGASSAAAMTDLPLPLRQLLEDRFDAWPMQLKKSHRSADGSVKYGWLTRENNPVEAVLMPGFDYGTAICVSSQSGCAMACRFCETGYMGLRQYLSAGEILQQLYHAEADSGVEVDRIVFMGMGEPLHNLRAVGRVIEVLTSADGRGWSPRRITVSTVGLVQPMLIMARTFPRVNLALSLHFTTPAGRTRHMPQSESDPRALAEALYYYRQMNGGKITIEYVLMQGENDSDADARRLVKFARLAGVADSGEAGAGDGTQRGAGRRRTAQTELVAEALSHEAPANQQPLPLHVNLIAYNPIPSADYRPTPEKEINRFARLLRDAEVPVTVRHSRGQDIAAACGQLGAEMLKTGTAE